jgi:hypothetical protein
MFNEIIAQKGFDQGKALLMTEVQQMPVIVEREITDPFRTAQAAHVLFFLKDLARRPGFLQMPGNAQTRQPAPKDQYFLLAHRYNALKLNNITRSRERH